MAQRKMPNNSKTIKNLDKLPANNIEPVETPVVSTAVSVNKRKPKSGFAYEVASIGNMLYEDVILPGLKSSMSEFFSTAIEMFIFGGDSIGRGGSSRRGGTNYNAISTRERRQSPPRRHQALNTAMDLDQVVYETRSDAARVLAAMHEYIGQYGWVTVANLHEFSGVSTSMNQSRYGWESVSGTTPKKTHGGWYLDLPEPMYDG